MQSMVQKPLFKKRIDDFKKRLRKRDERYRYFIERLTNKVLQNSNGLEVLFFFDAKITAMIKGQLYSRMFQYLTVFPILRPLCISATRNLQTS